MTEELEGQSGEASTPVELTERMTPKEITDMGVALWKNEIFCDVFLPPGSENLVGSVFMPLMFINREHLSAHIEAGFHHVWEFISAAAPRSINGYPSFFSMNFIHFEDLEAAFEHMKKVERVMKELNGES